MQERNFPIMQHFQGRHQFKSLSSSKITLLEYFTEIESKIDSEIIELREGILMLFWKRPTQDLPWALIEGLAEDEDCVSTTEWGVEPGKEELPSFERPPDLERLEVDGATWESGGSGGKGGGQAGRAEREGWDFEAARAISGWC